MIDKLLNLNPIISSLLASTITFFITSLGSAVVFIINKENKNLNRKMLALSSGIMLAASFFSLINPALDLAVSLNYIPYLICGFGIICGSLFIIIGNKYCENKLKKKTKLMYIISIILHNIPEGAAIGVAFGSITSSNSSNIIAAWLLAIGIGIQNFPEGAAISLPLLNEGKSKIKSFIIGALSGIVEPIAAILGCILAYKVNSLLPFLLSFAAGSMLFVITNELIPEAQDDKENNITNFITIIGFVIMMILDVALG